MSVYYAKFGVGIYGLYKAFRISEDNKALSLIPVTDDTDVSFDDLIGLEQQKAILKENTEAFLNGFHANNVLLYGDSGTGKSTSIHALMHDYFDRGLRLVELSKQDRKLLPQVLRRNGVSPILHSPPEHFRTAEVSNDTPRISTVLSLQGERRKETSEKENN